MFAAFGRHKELAAAIALLRTSTPWVEAATALADSRYDDAATILGSIPSIPFRDAALNLAERHEVGLVPIGSSRSDLPFGETERGANMELITRGDATYDDDRSLFNSMVDKRPAVIAKCASARDVVEALELAARERYPIAVRAGGHSVAGMSSNDDGIVIDVRPMKHIEIDAAAMTARVGAGVTWSEFDRAGSEHGLATTGGRVSTTGVAGFTLGGGSGWLDRKCGLACDNLLAVDLVTADGREVTASEDENPELFWGLHGGGGNFGVATSFTFRMHHVGPEVLAGLLMWPGDAGFSVGQGVPRFRVHRARRAGLGAGVHHGSTRRVRSHPPPGHDGRGNGVALGRRDRRRRGGHPSAA